MPGYNNQHLIDGLIKTFLTDPFPDLGVDTDEYKATDDLVKKIAYPLHEHIVSWWNETGGGIFPDEMVKMSKDDLLSGYLGDKIDNDTIKYDTQTFKLYVNAIPFASNIRVGGIIVGANPESILYMEGTEILARVNTQASLSDLNNEIPSCRAVKLYVDNAIQSISISGGVGDMLKSTYDSNNNGIVDNTERLDNQLGSYYLNWDNFSNKPTTFTPSSHSLLGHSAIDLIGGYFLKAITDTTFGFLPHGLSYSDVNAEAHLGYPINNDYILSSTAAGVRSWIPIPIVKATFGTRTTGTNEGILGEIYTDDDYIYICVLAGEAGTAIWKRSMLSQT